ncbi:MAG: 16S rRNA (uracil(1498)-N(3))-methyltransferase [Ruminococcaceae bacterium]|nr:16S rRNA (uracil(1498)-N(3))-methyltransferase [Oscillospiraceae bacterium]
MHRFFIGTSLEGENSVTITGDDVSHIVRVLRLKEDDDIVVCDSDGTDCVCSITSFSKDEVTATILSRGKCQTEPPLSITLYQGVPKGDKLDTVVQKCVELGAVRIVPVAMKRSVAVIKDSEKKRQRLQKIADEAAKQCLRGKLVKVDSVMTFKQAIEDAKESFDLKLLPYEDERVKSIKEVLKESKDAKSVCIFIGPEGGFDSSEVELAKENGFYSVSMGPRILRTETAPLAAITAVMYELGDW